MVRVAVQSQLAKDRVAKLTYRLRGPYKIVEVIGHGAYHLRKFGKPESARLKYHAEDISMLPPAIRPVEPLDGPDLRYLNNSHALIPHPLKQAFDIKLYNEVWFSQPINTVPPKLLSDVDVPAPVQFASQPSVVTTRHTLEKASVTNVTSDVNFQVTTQHPLPLLRAIQQSHDKLFFVSFRPNGTLRARWYLVSVDLRQTELIVEQHGTPEQSGIYYVHFWRNIQLITTKQIH